MVLHIFKHITNNVSKNKAVQKLFHEKNVKLLVVRTLFCRPLYNILLDEYLLDTLCEVVAICVIPWFQNSHEKIS